MIVMFVGYMMRALTTFHKRNVRKDNKTSKLNAAIPPSLRQYSTDLRFKRLFPLMVQQIGFLRGISDLLSPCVIPPEADSKIPGTDESGQLANND